VAGTAVETILTRNEIEEAPMAVITISRQFGAGGITIGKMIAESLGYTFADNDILQRVAKEANVSTHWIESFEKEAGSKLSRLISSMVSKRWLDRVLADERGYLDEQIYLDYLVLIIAQFADEGDVVILGRGSQYILNDHPDAVHILLVNEFENRVNFMVDRYEVSRKKAERTVVNEDRRRVSLYKRLGKSDYENPQLYHMVLNMGRLDLETARDMVCKLVEHKLALNPA
jgi:cytidylate kinase